LQHVVADRGCGLERRFDIARIKELPLLLRMVRPNARETVGLQFNQYLYVIRCSGIRAYLLLPGLRQGSEEVLHVMAYFMRDYVCL